MENCEFIPRLTGGTFFVLLRRACSESTNNRSTLVDLIRLYNPKFNISLNSGTLIRYTSLFYNCKSDHALDYISAEQIAQFDIDVVERYPELLNRAEKFVKRNIDDAEKADQLVCALLELVEKDDQIKDKTKLYIDSDGFGEFKDRLDKIGTFYLPSFILGIWHYIVSNRINNIDGRETFLEWHARKADIHSTSSFRSKIGVNYRDNIAVIFPSEQSNPSLTSSSNIFQISEEDFLLCEDEEEDDPLPTPGGQTLMDILSEIGDIPDPYFERAYEKYRSLKTVLYKYTLEPFYNFYVCNDLKLRSDCSSEYHTLSTISDINAEKLKGISNYIVISGTGGLGKSMMMRHLLLSSIPADPYENGENPMMPVLVPVRNYDPKEQDLMHLIFSCYSGLQGFLDFQEFQALFNNNQVILLLDGLDEVKKNYARDFNVELEKIVDEYPGNMYVVSSRPYSSFASLTRFTILDLCPFTLSQAKELIRKLDFRPDEPMIKENFINEIHTRLFWTHHDFCTNPLLLTIMLITYEQFAEIPSKMHKFYEEAYMALAMGHDKFKVGFERSFRTGLSADEFGKLFAEFCARTYKDEKYEFTKDEVEEYYRKCMLVKNGHVRGDCTDFIYDLLNNVCLLYYEGGSYCFTHRSFQEYFCAVFFSKQKDRTLYSIGEFFNSKPDITESNESTFDMLHDMIPSKIKEFVFIEYLEKLFKDKVRDYWDYLEFQYPDIIYISGETRGDVPSNEGEDFLIRKICEYNGFLHESFEELLPFVERLVVEEYFYLDADLDEDLRLKEYADADSYPFKSSYYLVSMGELPSYSDSAAMSAESAGYELAFKPEDIRGRSDEFDILYDSLNDAGFPLHMEYDALIDYYEESIRQRRISTSSDDFFSQFEY